MDQAKRTVGCTARGFLTAWRRGEAGPVPWRRPLGLLSLRRHPYRQEARSETPAPPPDGAGP
jgi:hypothetical protein